MIHKKHIFLFIVLVVLMAACSTNASEAPMPDGLTGGSVAYSEPANEEAAAESRSDGDFEAQDITFSAANSAEGGESQSVSQPDRLIIRTGNLGLIVSHTEETAADIARMAEQSGGWVVSSNLYQYNADAKSGDITIRVPAAGFYGAMEALKSMAVKVESESTSGQDVTEEYVDLEARLGNLEATAVRVRTFLDDAITVEEALAVNQELSRLEGEIEVIKGRMQYLSQSAAFSTITVYMTPDIAAQPVQIGGWQPQGVAKEAVEALIGALQGLATFAIWLIIYVLPIALLVGVPIYLVVRFIWRRWQRRKMSNAKVEAPAVAE